MPRAPKSDLTFAEIERRVKQADDQAIVLTASLAVGAVMVVGGVLTAGVAALGLLAGKDELFKVGGKLLEKARKRKKESAIERHQRMLAAHQLVVYSAFLSATRDVLTFVHKSAPSEIGEAEFSALALAQMAAGDAKGAELIINPPHPAGSPDYGRSLLAFYTKLTSDLSTQLEALPEFAASPEPEQARLRRVLGTASADAVEEYNAQSFALAADHPPFRAWLDIRNNERMMHTLGDLPDRVAEQLVTAFGERLELDVGLARLGRERAVAANEVTEALARTYEDAITKPIADGRANLRAGATALTYPTKLQAFIPQAFKVLHTIDGGARLEDDATWDGVESREDLSEFLLKYLVSSYSTQTPLVILGHPGSGKSLLTEMIAAHTAAQQFTPLRLQLRDVDMDSEIFEQLETQITKDTNGERITWARLSNEITFAPPVAIFDGFDELLQSSGTKHATYIENLRDFQDSELVQGRELRTIITSRVTLIDKARVPPGSTVIRLLEFDQQRQSRWIDIWNVHNTSYFSESKTYPFTLPEREDVRELAQQPLLLFLLALFDADRNRLRGRRAVSRAQLYNELLMQFLERQRVKDAEDRKLPVGDLRAALRNDMSRLGIAAVGMFNRHTVHLRRDELTADLTYFGQDPSRTALVPDADDIFARFFFVHVSRSHPSAGATPYDEGPAAYEFLHNTFGEFLTADFILRTLINEVSGCSAAAEKGVSPSSEWYATLMYTALYTRPVVLQMMNAWLPLLLDEHRIDRDVFSTDLDAFVRSQLQSILDNTQPPSAFTENEAPYPDLPLIGHYAIYTLNLVLLRVVTDHTPFVFNNAPLPSSSGGTTPWERLTSLWRAWFSVDHLAAVAGVIDSHHEHDDVAIVARDSFTEPTGTAPLETAWLAASALSDRLTAAALAAHMHDAGDRHPVALLEVADDLEAEAVDLDLELRMRSIRNDGWPLDSGHVHALENHARRAIALMSTSRSHRDLLTALTRPDAPVRIRAEARRELRSPRFADGFWTAPDSFAVAYIRFCASTEPRWAAEVVAEALRGDRPVQLAREMPNAFAACLDLIRAAEEPHHIVVGFEDLTWLGAALRPLLSHEMAPVVLVAVLDVAVRTLPETGDHAIIDACQERLLSERASDVLGGLGTDRLRRLILLTDDVADDMALVDWIRAGAGVRIGDRPCDVVVDLDRLELRAKARTRIDTTRVDAWPVLRNDHDLSALRRLLAWLEPDPDAAWPPGPTLGRDSLIRYLREIAVHRYEL